MKTQLEKLCEQRPRVTIKAHFVGEIASPWNDVGSHLERQRNQTVRHYRVTLRHQGRSLTTDFYQGMGHSKDPTAADVLSCLCSDASAAAMTFDEFCAEFGHDSDSRKALATYEACCKIAPKVKRLLGSNFSMYWEAEH